MNRFYSTPYINVSGKTLLQVVLEELPQVGIVNGKETRPQWESISSHGSHNILATNKGIVEVIADDSVIAMLDADPRFPSPFALDKLGEPDEVKRVEYQVNLKTARSDERQRKHKVQRAIERVDKTISKAETIIIRKEAFRANREQSRKDLVTIKRNLLSMRGGSFVGDVESVITKIKKAFIKTENFRVNMTVDDKAIVVKYSKSVLLEGIRKGVKADISTVIQAENGLNVRIDNHVKARDKLIGEITNEQFQINGVVKNGQNLEQRKMELQTKLKEFTR